MRHDSIYRASASEFPHDNPDVDRGALWVGSPLCRLTPQPPLVLEEETPEHSGVVMRPAALAAEPLALDPEDFVEELGAEEAATLPQVVELVSGAVTNDVGADGGAPLLAVAGPVCVAAPHDDVLSMETSMADDIAAALQAVVVAVEAAIVEEA